MNFVFHELNTAQQCYKYSPKKEHGHSRLNRRKGAAMLGLCTFGNVGVTRMTTSWKIRAAINENDEYLCNIY